jgi:transposase, IS5 family
MIIDASCAPQYIAYPQDINLLDDARKKLESMIDRICVDHSLEKLRACSLLSGACMTSRNNFF